jgi:hypothetical protein
MNTIKALSVRIKFVCKPYPQARKEQWTRGQSIFVHAPPQLERLRVSLFMVHKKKGLFPGNCWLAYCLVTSMVTTDKHDLKI